MISCDRDRTRSRIRCTATKISYTHTGNISQTSGSTCCDSFCCHCVNNASRNIPDTCRTTRGPNFSFNPDERGSGGEFSNADLVPPQVWTETTSASSRLRIESTRIPLKIVAPSSLFGFPRSLTNRMLIIAGKYWDVQIIFRVLVKRCVDFYLIKRNENKFQIFLEY